jgi:hypothetical protein
MMMVKTDRRFGIKTRFMIEASGHVLCEYFPDNFCDLSDDELEAFVMDNLSEEYECHPYSAVIERIEDMARGFERTANKSSFEEWMDNCPDHVSVNHDYTDDEDEVSIHVYGFSVDKKAEIERVSN